jgi:hypothetical protein
VKSRAIILCLAAAIVLTGCTATNEPVTPTASAESSTTATPTPTATAESSTDPTTLELSTEALQVLSEDGTELQSFSHFVPVDDAVVAALSAAIGADPIVTKNGEDQANPDYVTYEWEGALLTATNAPADTQYANWTFSVTSASVGSLNAVTDSGISVGSTRAEAEAAGAVLDETGSEVFYRLGITDIDRNGEPLPFCLYLGATDDVIDSISGPAHENQG